MGKHGHDMHFIHKMEKKDHKTIKSQSFYSFIYFSINLQVTKYYFNLSLAYKVHFFAQAPIG